jgi:ABC-2 type transport system permease protein
MRSIFGDFIVITQNIQMICLSILVTVLAYMLSYLGKMVIGLTAFWFTDYRGFSEFISVVILLFSGFVVPIEFFPTTVKFVAQCLPFAYSIYYPILAWQGRLAMPEFAAVISIQCIWIAMFYIFYLLLWKKGVREYSAIGQ